MLEKGATGLNDEELLAICLGSGLPGTNAIELAQNLLKEHELKAMVSLPLEDLLAFKGIGQSKALILKAIYELAERIMVKLPHHVVVKNPEDIMHLTHHIADKKQEFLVGIYLDARYRVITQETLSIGTVNSSFIHPREVFAPAITHRAAGVVLVHNHPSGDVSPSVADLDSTDRMVEAGKLLGMPLLDHIIIANQDWFSFKHQQLL